MILLSVPVLEFPNDIVGDGMRDWIYASRIDRCVVMLARMIPEVYGLTLNDIKRTSCPDGEGSPRRCSKREDLRVGGRASGRTPP